MNFNDSISKMIEDHNGMKIWHETMAKSSAEAMQDHIKAASWHESQMNLIKSMKEVPLDPDAKKTTIPAGSYTPAPSSGGGKKGTEKEIPLDPETVKKSELIDLLKSHAEKYGDFDMDLETVANFLLNQ